MEKDCGLTSNQTTSPWMTKKIYKTSDDFNVTKKKTSDDFNVML